RHVDAEGLQLHDQDTTGQEEGELLGAGAGPLADRPQCGGEHAQIALRYLRVTACDGQRLDGEPGKRPVPDQRPEHRPHLVERLPGPLTLASECRELARLELVHAGKEEGSLAAEQPKDVRLREPHLSGHLGHCSRRQPVLAKRAQTCVHGLCSTDLRRPSCGDHAPRLPYAVTTYYLNEEHDTWHRTTPQERSSSVAHTSSPATAARSTTPT